MMDKEKVIEGLCDAIGIIHGHVPKRYWGYGEQACRDAISMLKEQEEVEPKVIRMNAFGDPVYACWKCGVLITESMNYCHKCGKLVKWNDSD